MANSIYKVTANGVSVIDLSDTTAVASDIKKGKAAHLQDGSLAYGTDDRPSKVSSVTLTSSGIHKAPEDESWSMVNVKIPYETPKPITPTNDVQVIKPGASYEALESVTINPIPDDYIVPTGEINIKNNGRHNVKLYEHAFVEVQPNLENKKVTITQNGVKTYSAGSGYDGIETIEVNVQVPPEDISLQNKEVTITENKEETYYADSGYDGLSSIKVKVEVSGEDVPVWDKIFFKSNDTEIEDTAPEWDRAFFKSDDAEIIGGLDINGIIREYEVNAGASVSAGDFVEFVNKADNSVMIQKATSNLYNVGVAKTSGEEGEMIEVYCAV